MTLEGGKRDRMIWMAMWSLIREYLELLGWLDDPVANDLDRQAVEVPWNGIADPENIVPNVVVVMPEDTTFLLLETGSNLQGKSRTFIIDIYAEDHAVGLNLRGDISAILRGDLPSLGRTENKLEVTDEDLATPAVVATMDIENVREDRAVAEARRPWERYWYSIICTVDDEDWGDDL